MAAGIAEVATGYRPSSSSPVPIAVTGADVAGLWVGLLASCLFASRTRGSGSLVADFGWRVGAWWDVPLGAAVGLACQFVVLPLLYLPFERADRTLAHQLSQPAQRDTAAAHGSGPTVVLLLLLAVGAPIFEELFFRGLLLQTLLERTSAPTAAVVSGLLFALAHLEALQFAGLAVVGVVLAALTIRAKRLGPSIAAHVSFNAAAVLTVVHFH